MLITVGIGTNSDYGRYTQRIEWHIQLHNIFCLIIYWAENLVA